MVALQKEIKVNKCIFYDWANSVYSLVIATVFPFIMKR
jgi:MFS-type transporter involved in bile tolerance (Atg22 family)